MTSLAIDFAQHVGPFNNASELLDVMLSSTRDRLRIVSDLDRRREPVVWTAEVLATEAALEGRVRATASALVPIARVRERFTLSETESRLLWTLISAELCSICRECLRSLDGRDLLDPTIDALRRAVYGTNVDHRKLWTELSETGALRRLGLIERTDVGTSTPLNRQTWKASERVLALAHGELSLDPAFAAIASHQVTTPLRVRLELSTAVVNELASACRGDGVVVAYGRAGSGRRSVLEQLIGNGSRLALRINGRAVSKDRDAAARELRGLARECALLGLVPLIRDLDALGPIGEVADRIDLVESELSGLVLATSNQRIARRWRRAVTQVELGTLNGEQRARVWLDALPSIGSQRADELATLYPIAPALVHAAGAIIRERSENPDVQQIASGLRSVLDDRLAGLATRIETSQTWDDLVLPDEQLGAIVELMSRIRERRVVYERWGFAAKVGKGLGMAALLSGPPGTGKTMAAGLIARELGVELYQVDLSKIVSKWIGETEKNLAALFDAAEAGHAVLLFDEADALFGKRTEVRSSNDRYANQEVNFLLQRLESFTGIVILTTNHETAIDEAFRRRLSVHVRFPMPEPDERLNLWRAMIPSSAPTAASLRLEQLADRFEMSGGYIRNAVLRAAFLAAAEDEPIANKHLLRAAQLEYEAMGKLATTT